MTKQSQKRTASRANNEINYSKQSKNMNKMQEEGEEIMERKGKKQKINKNSNQNQKEGKIKNINERDTNNGKLKQKIREKEKNKKQIQAQYSLRDRKARNERENEGVTTRNNQKRSQNQDEKKEIKEKSSSKRGKSQNNIDKKDKGQKKEKKNQDQIFNKEELKILSQGSSASFGQQIRKKIEEFEQKQNRKVNEPERSQLEEKYRTEFQQQFLKKYKEIQEYYKKEKKDLEFGQRNIYPNLSPLEKLFYDIKTVKRKAVMDANKRCRFSYTRKQSNFSLSRAHFWENFQQLAKGSQVYKTPQGREFHNWLCFQCFYVYKDSQEVINDLMMRFSAEKAKLVIANVVWIKKGEKLFRDDISREILGFLC